MCTQVGFPKVVGIGPYLFQWGQSHLVRAPGCGAVYADVYSAARTDLQETTCACWIVEVMFGNVQKHLRMLSHWELQH